MTSFRALAAMHADVGALEAKLLRGLADTDPISGCREWIKARTNRGYGTLRRGGQMDYAHRIAYELWVGPIPPGMLVCHRCDNPVCCAIGHLFLGTNADNSADKVSKRRHTFGEGIAQSKLTRKDVLEMRTLHASGEFTVAKLAAMFGVCGPTASETIRGKKWKSVPMASALAELDGGGGR